jgi:hypothetical protein
MPAFYPFSIFHMAEFREKEETCPEDAYSLTVVWPED